jgi:hypothetical protein
MTIQQKVVAFLKAMGREKAMETFQISKAVYAVWANAGNVPLAKLDRVFEEMEKFNAEKENEARAEEARKRDDTQHPTVLDTESVETTSPIPPAPEGMFTPNSAPMPLSRDAIEAEFQELRTRIERLERFEIRMTDPDLIRTSSFTRPDQDKNKPNAVMEPKFVPVDNTPMTEAEHEAKMAEVGNKIQGSNDWLTPYKVPPYQKK